MFKKLLFILLILFLPIQVFSAPSISSVSGEINHGNSITISGSAFTSKSQAAPVIWDDASGNSFNDIWGSNFLSNCGDSSLFPHYSTPIRNIPLPHQNVNKYIAGSHGGNDPSCGTNDGSNVAFWNIRSISSYPQYTFISVYQRYDDNWDFGNSDNNLKAFGFSDSSSHISGGNYDYISYNGGPDSSTDGVSWLTSPYHFINSPDQNGHSHYWNSAVNPMSGVWSKVELEIKWTNQNDGYIKLWENGVLRMDYSDVTYPAGSSGTLLEGIGGYVRESGKVDNWRYYSDVYLDYSRARIILANNADINQATIKEVQIPSQWNGNSITADVNLGKFSNGETAYLFVYDVNGVPNSNGYPITIGSGTSNPGNPTISSVSGTTSDGNTVSISGNNFGSDITDDILIWDDFEDGTIGANLNTGGKWSTSSNNGPSDPVFDNSRVYSGLKSGYADITEQGDSESYLSNIDTENIYVSLMFNYYVDGNPSTTKGVRVHANDGPNEYTSYPSIMAQDYYSSNRLTIAPNEESGSSSNYEPDNFPENSWLRTEYYFKMSSPAGSDNGIVQSWIDNNLDSSFNGVTRASGVSDKYQKVLMPFYMGNGGGGHLWYDDVYISKTLSRIEICDSSTWSNRNHCEIQIPISWNNNNLQFELNQGKFNDGQTVFLYVIDSENNPSNPQSITIQGGNTQDNTNPTISITSPTSSSTYTTTSSSISLSGSASDNVALSSVSWSCQSGCSGNGNAVGTNSWATSNIALISGQNIIRVTATDTSDNTNTDTITVTYNEPQNTGDPSISSVSGTASNGNTISISGSNFGLMNGDIVSWDNFDSQTLGSTILGKSPLIGPTWSTQYSYNGNGARFDNSNVHSGNLAAHLDWSIDTKTIRAFGWANQGPYDELFISYWRYMEGDYSSNQAICDNGGYPCNHKQFYLFGNNGDFPQGMPLIPGGTESWGFYNNGGSASGNYNDRNNMNTIGLNYANTRDKYQRWDFYTKLNNDINCSPQDTCDGIIKYWVDGDLARENSQYKHRIVDGLYDDFRLGNMAQGFTDTAKAWFDDLYISTSQARIELCNTPTWDARSHCEIQITRESNWGQSSISTEINTGSFNSGETAYLYVIDENGDVNQNGQAITIGGGSSNPVNPSISSVSGTTSDGNTISVSGSNFGVKSPAEPWLYDNFDDGVNGDIIAGDASLIGNRPYSFYTSSAEYGYGPTGSLGVYYYDDNSQSTARGNIVVEGQATQKRYLSYDFYRNRIVDNSDPGVRKINRQTSGLGNGNNNPNYDDPPNFGADGYFHYNNCNEFVSTGVWTADYPRNILTRNEWWMTMSDVNVANGKYSVWRDYSSLIDLDLVTCGSSCNNGCQIDTWMSSNYVNDDDIHETFLDNLYIDNTLARIEICDSPNWNSRTKCEIQLPKTWNSNSLQFELNQGDFNDGEDVFLYIIDSENNPSNPQQITIQGGTTNPGEVCDNNIDDDNNGFTDCNDSACSSHSSCLVPTKPEDNLIAFFDFDNNLNNLVSGSSISLSSVGGGTYQSGKYSSAFNFDGVDDHLSFSEYISSGKDEFSLSFWINPDICNAGDAIFDEGSNAYWQYTIQCNFWLTRDTSTGETGGRNNDLTMPNINSNTWTHLVFVYSVSNNEKTIYLNGNEVQSTSTSIDTLTSQRSNSWFGRPTDGSFFEGSLDELLIFDRALTLSEINYLYNNEYSINDPNPPEDPVCGNNIIETGETCDNGVLNTDTCPYGSQNCNVCTTECEIKTGPVSYCGDGIIDSSNNEECDGNNNGASCSEYSFSLGQVSCSNSCSYDISACYNEGPDTNPPLLTITLSDKGTLAVGTTSILLEFTTQETATCKYSNNMTFDYETSGSLFNGEDKIHNITLTNLTIGSYEYFIKCKDLSENINTNDEPNFFIFTIPEEVVTPPDNGGSGGSSSSRGGGGGGSSKNNDKPSLLDDDSNICIPDYNAQSWSTCLGGEQRRLVFDDNKCVDTKTETRKCTLKNTEIENKFLNAKKIDIQKSENRKRTYNTKLTASYNEIFKTDEKLEDESFVLVDGESGEEYLGKLVEENNGEFFYSLERIDESNLADLKFEGLVPQTISENVDSGFRSLFGSPVFITIVSVVSILLMLGFIIYLIVYIRRIHE